MHVQESHIDIRPKDNQDIETYMPSWAKEKGLEAWRLQGKEPNSQKDGKGKYLINKCLPYHTETMGHEKSLNQQSPGSVPQLTTCKCPPAHTLCSYL